TVLADDTDALAAHHRQVDTGEDRATAERDAGIDELDHTVATAGVRVQLERDLAPLEHGAVDLLHPVDLALLVPRLFDVPLVDDPVRPVLEAPHRLLEPRNLLLLRHVELLLAVQLELASEGVGGVVAGPHADATSRELRDRGDGLVEEVPVVRDGDDGAVEGTHQLLERLDVEVRLGLVEEQHVRVAEETCSQADELSLAAGEHPGRRAGMVALVETDVEQQRTRTALEPGTTGRSPAPEDVLLPPQQARDPVQVVRRLAERLLDLLELTLERVQLGPRSAQRGRRVALVAFELLRQVGKDESAALRHVAAIRSLFTGEDAQERRLAASVRTDQPDASAGLDVEVEPLEDLPRAEALAQAADREQRHT